MAKFNLELPTELIKDIEKLNNNAEDIFGEMTRAGAAVVVKNLENNAPSNLRPYIKMTRTYKTPSDNGINTKAYISGYMPFSNPNREYFSRAGGNGKSYSTNKGVPADFIAQLYEYGRSTAPFPKKPFLRKSFKKDEIEKAMLKVQNKRFGDIFGADEVVK